MSEENLTANTEDKSEEKLMTEAEIEEEKNRLLSRYVEPHRKIAREVTEEDIDRLSEEVKVCYKLCFINRGNYLGAKAIAHPQIDDKDPLRFFVTKNGELVVNPIILRQVKTIQIEKEGCLSFPDFPEKYIARSTKLTVQFDTIDFETKKIKGTSSIEIKGIQARIFQHEIDHLSGKNIYEDY